MEMKFALGSEVRLIPRCTLTHRPWVVIELNLPYPVITIRAKRNNRLVLISRINALDRSRWLISEEYVSVSWFVDVS